MSLFELMVNGAAYDFWLLTLWAAFIKVLETRLVLTRSMTYIRSSSLE